MAMPFEHLFAPIKIGPKTAKNRIAFPSHGTRFPFFRDNTDGSQYIEYHRARARGGCGLTVIGTLIPHWSSYRPGALTPPTPGRVGSQIESMNTMCIVSEIPMHLRLSSNTSALVDLAIHLAAHCLSDDSPIEFAVCVFTSLSTHRSSQIGIAQDHSQFLPKLAAITR